MADFLLLDPIHEVSEMGWLLTALPAEPHNRAA
jgi:hypothetical protein